jgi:hypothetical protein
MPDLVCCANSPAGLAHDYSRPQRAPLALGSSSLDGDSAPGIRRRRTRLYRSAETVFGTRGEFDKPIFDVESHRVLIERVDDQGATTHGLRYLRNALEGVFR